MLLVAASVAISVCVPAVTKVALNVLVPLVNVLLAGRVVAPVSVEVIATDPP